MERIDYVIKEKTICVYMKSLTRYFIHITEKTILVGFFRTFYSAISGLKAYYQSPAGCPYVCLFGASLKSLTWEIVNSVIIRLY